MKSISITAALITAVLLTTFVSVSSAQEVQALKVTPGGTHPSIKEDGANFSGAVRIESRFHAESPARTGGAIVAFEPGARTAWHTHLLGQTLIVKSGSGLVQHWNGPKQEIRRGDIVWIPPGVKHWHGASASAAMTHVAIAESLEGKAVDWMEQVSDAQYGGRP